MYVCMYELLPAYAPFICTYLDMYDRDYTCIATLDKRESSSMQSLIHPVTRNQTVTVLSGCCSSGSKGVVVPDPRLGGLVWNHYLPTAQQCRAFRT